MWDDAVAHFEIVEEAALHPFLPVWTVKAEQGLQT